MQNFFRIACISCPTLFQKLVKLLPERVVLFEYDTRFEKYGNFVHYDYNLPLNLSKDLEHSFDFVVADPPFLAEECLEKIACTIFFLKKDKILLCTGKCSFKKEINLAFYILDYTGTFIVSLRRLFRSFDILFDKLSPY